MYVWVSLQHLYLTLACGTSHPILTIDPNNPRKGEDVVKADQENRQLKQYPDRPEKRIDNGVWLQDILTALVDAKQSQKPGSVGRASMLLSAVVCLGHKQNAEHECKTTHGEEQPECDIPVLG
jgi:hypothetical protein